MSVPTVLVAGTWGYTGTKQDTESWWSPGSPFWREAEHQGLHLLGQHDPFVWTTDLGGVVGRRRFVDWKAAGEALRWYAMLKVHQGLKAGEQEPFPIEVNVVAHSHGGATAVYAAARLVTVGTPVRADMHAIYERAAKRVTQWIHLYATGDRPGRAVRRGLGDHADDARSEEYQRRRSQSCRIAGHCPMEGTGMVQSLKITSVLWMAFLVIVSSALAFLRPYHPVAISAFAETHHTHVCTTGTVTLVKREADGDWHIRVSDGTTFIVAEIIPTLTGVKGGVPKKDQKVEVCGIRRYDDERGHGWWEIHAVESIRVIK